jgi:hypothetical protein
MPGIRPPSCRARSTAARCRRPAVRYKATLTVTASNQWLRALRDMVQRRGKAWHGLHYLPASTKWQANDGAGSAILGGQPIGEDNGHGPARGVRGAGAR